MLLQLLIPLVTWSVVNVSADVNDVRLISLYTSRVSREEVCQPSLLGELSVEVVGNVVWNILKSRKM